MSRPTRGPKVTVAAPVEPEQPDPELAVTTGAPTGPPSPAGGTSPAGPAALASAGRTSPAGPAALASLPGPEPRRIRRRPRSRLEPGVLEAARRAGTREGLEWLGREPESRASILYRAVRLLARLLAFGVFRFRIEASGREHLPAGGGYLLVGAAHRGWMDPFVVMHALPVQPRAWFLGSGPSTFTARWRERFIHVLGGLLPVWRGGLGIDGHVAAARAVIGGGGIFVQMPEGTVSGPAGRIGPFRPGAALIAIRTGAPLVPLVIVGTEELYIGRRMASKVLPATSVARAARRCLGRHPPGARVARRARAGQATHGPPRGAPRPRGRDAPSTNRRPAVAPATAAQAAHLAVPAPWTP